MWPGQMRVSACSLADDLPKISNFCYVFHRHVILGDVSLLAPVLFIRANTLLSRKDG